MKAFGCVLAAVLPLASPAAGVYPYGVNAHLTRNEFENHELALQMMAQAGIRHVRVPITYSYVCTNGVCDFSACDAVFANCRKHGVELQFDGPVEFYNLYGERFLPKNPAKGRYCVEISGRPIYFANGRMEARRAKTRR